MLEDNSHISYESTLLWTLSHTQSSDINYKCFELVDIKLLHIRTLSATRVLMWAEPCATNSQITFHFKSTADLRI